MKNTIFLFLAAATFSLSVKAQSTVDSINSKYTLLPMPGPLTTEKAFPVIGTYQLQGTADATQSITLSLDPDNKGIVWVEGLPQGKFKAYLKKSPGTYRITSQTGADGKAIPEGTLVYHPETAVLNIALGSAYNDAEPESVFTINTATPEAEGTVVKTKTKTAKTKVKQKVTFYTATKNVVEMQAQDSNAAKDSTVQPGTNQ